MLNMPWIDAASLARLVDVLNADIVHELTAADYYLRLAQFVKEWRDPSICHQIAVCAATTIKNATALAAEVMALGGVPPANPASERAPLPAATSVEEHLIDARAELAHFQGRLTLARRLGLLRLQDVLRNIVLSKRQHLEHVQVIASACLSRRPSAR